LFHRNFIGYAAPRRSVISFGAVLGFVLEVKVRAEVLVFLY
jgi:hypothetical protein